MLSPQRALLCNLNHIHLQHVSLGLHLSRRPELREGPLSTPPPPGDTGGKESRGPCSGTLVDANSNSPAVPCRCCQEHGPSIENQQDPSQEEEAASPSDPGCSSSLSSCSDLSPDESPVSVYSRDLPGNEDANPQPSILELGSPLAPAGPSTCSPDSFCCTPDSCSGISSPPGPDLDSNCNALTTCQDLPSPSLEEEEDNGEQDLATSELSETEDGRIDAGKAEPSWKINPIWKIDTKKIEAGRKPIEDQSDSGWKTGENTNSSLKTGSGKLASCSNTNSGSKIDAGKTDGGWRGDVSQEPVPHRTITSFHELAQKRKRGPGLPLVPQAKKDRSDWLIVFSPDTELPPTGSLGGSLAPPREVTTFKELRSRSRAQPPPVPPRDPPAGWALVPPRPPPPPVPPRRKKNRLGLQPIAEGLSEEGRAASLPAGEEASAPQEPEEPRAHAVGKKRGPAGGRVLSPPLVPSFCSVLPAPSPGRALGKGNWVDLGVKGLTLCSSLSRPSLPGCRPHCPPPLHLAPPIPPAAGPSLFPRPPVFRFSADGRPLLEGGGAGAPGSLLFTPLTGRSNSRLQLLGAASPPEEQLLPVRLSPVGAYSPPTRGALPCLASPELALLLSPLFPRSSTFPAAAPLPRQVPAPPLPTPPCPPTAPRWTRRPPPPPRQRKTDPGQPRGPRLGSLSLQYWASLYLGCLARSRPWSWAGSLRAH